MIQCWRKFHSPPRNKGWNQGILGGKYQCTVDLLFDRLESAVWLLTIFVCISKTDQSKPVKQEVNGTVILPPLVFPDERFHEHYISFGTCWCNHMKPCQCIRLFFSHICHSKWFHAMCVIMLKAYLVSLYSVLWRRKHERGAGKKGEMFG